MIPLFDMIQAVLKSVPANFTMLIPVVVWPKMWVCGFFIAGMTSLNPAESMNVCLLGLLCVVCCVDSGVCNELVTHSEESCGVCVRLIVRDL
jgi:hypothetical protein